MPAVRRRVTLRLTVATPRALPLEWTQRIDHRAVVGAMAGGLHDHVAREAEVVAQARKAAASRHRRACICAPARTGNSAPGPNTWQCASTAPAGTRNRGFDGPAYQSSQPGVFWKSIVAWSQIFSSDLTLASNPVGLDAPIGAARKRLRTPRTEQRRRRQGRRSRPGARRCPAPTMASARSRARSRRPRAPLRCGGGRARSRAGRNRRPAFPSRCPERFPSAKPAPRLRRRRRAPW